MVLYLVGFVVIAVIAAVFAVLAISHSGRTKRAYLDSFISMILLAAAELVPLYGVFAKSGEGFDFQKFLVVAVGTLVVAALNLLALIVSAIRKGFRTPDPEDAPPPPPPEKERKHKDKD